jgi:predicted RNA methylase
MPLTSHDRELGQFIPLHYHGIMLLDQARMQNFRAAIAQVVPVGGTVVDLGGGTGVLSYFAAQNARKVWCVERIPQMAERAAQIIAMNGCQDRVEVIRTDAFDYLPPEPVDVVVCEMLHVGLLREQQLPVLRAFKQRYAEAYPHSRPAFIPDITMQAVQPVQQDYVYEGYTAPTPLFQDPLSLQPRTLDLGTPVIYQTVDYRADLPTECGFHGFLTITTAGRLNAVRIITKNLLALDESRGTSIDWHNQYLVVPLPESREVQPGDRLLLHFSYRPGDPLEAFAPTIE